MNNYVRLMLELKRPLEEVMSWSPEVMATVDELLEEKYWAERDAAKDAGKGR